MTIGGTSLYNAYAGNYFANQSRSTQTPETTGTQPGAPAAAIEDTKPGSGSVKNIQHATAAAGAAAEQDTPDRPGKASASENENGKNASDRTSRLSEEDLQTVRQLKQRDQEVRAHEAAHLAAAGKYATGGASFEYQRGPDGKSYAVGGEVGINTSPVPNDPLATIQKARQIKAAALAPADPSSTDRQVAASASRMEAEARQELADKRLQERDDSSDASEGPEGEKTHLDDSRPGHIDNVAASAYKAMDALSRPETNAVSPVDLTA